MDVASAPGAPRTATVTWSPTGIRSYCMVTPSAQYFRTSASTGGVSVSSSKTPW
ncbi:hypothetical protein QRX60_37505 [Amycolatopsis mongoliensis]|uniref:Uncharacterized protein n=1 Tax=Amycolatopsis mongoliensis TaxID=715475 RepID=A0A9Y2JJE1_9PSEU|nr:hypothetical protein [Amycolatopsis sp. 4-36]WIX99710.1 hypothetical protein QRX60_37505 [Amycolatopsis sp. 4-36]